VKTATLNGQINILNQLNYYWLPNDNTPRTLELEILLSAESLTNAFQLTNPADVRDIHSVFLVQNLLFYFKFINFNKR
jgi:hypothetical protein